MARAHKRVGEPCRRTVPARGIACRAMVAPMQLSEQAVEAGFGPQLANNNRPPVFHKLIPKKFKIV
jgi:hypothetical protein